MKSHFLINQLIHCRLMIIYPN